MAGAISRKHQVNKETKSGLSGVGSMMTGAFLIKVLGMLRLVFFAPLLGTSGFALFKLAQTATAIFSAIGGLGLFSAHIRYIPETATQKEKRVFVLRVIRLSLTSSVIAGIIVILFREKFAHFFFSDAKYSKLAVIVAFTLPAMIVYKNAVAAANGLHKFGVSAIGENIQNLIFLVLGFAMLFVFGKTPEIASMAFLIALFASSLYLMPFTVPEDKGEINHQRVNTVFNRALKYSLWYSLIPVFQYLYDFIDRIALAHYIDLDTTGSYSLIPILAQGMFIIGMGLTPVMARKCSHLYANKNKASSFRIIFGCISMSFIGSLIYSFFLVLFAPVIWAVIGKKWGAASSVLPYYLTFNILYNFYYIVGCFVMLFEKTYVHLIALSGGSLLNIILNIILVKKYGIIGASIGTMLGMSVSCIVHLIFLYVKKVRMPAKTKLVFALSFLPVLPKPLFIVASLIVFYLAFFTNTIMNDTDRRMMKIWIEPIRRKIMGRIAA